MESLSQVITKTPIKPTTEPIVEPKVEPQVEPLPEPFAPFEDAPIAPIAPPRPDVLEPDKLCPSQKERITRRIKREMPGEGE